MFFRFSILLIFFVSFKSNSQDGLIYRNIEIPNILTENINSIFIDNRGFNWISTDEGLVRYDGVNSTFFRSNPFDENTISDNSIQNVFQSDSDGVFISTLSGLDYFNYNKLLFKRIESTSTPTSNYKHLNHLFISTENEGLFIYDLKKDTIIENLKFDPRNPLSISSSNFNSDQNDNIILISEDNDSSLWIGTINGLNNYNLKTKSNKRFYSGGSQNSISSNFIYDLYSYDSLLFVGTDLGLSTINIKDNSIKQIDFLKNTQVYNIFEISGNLCFHTSKGIYKLQNLSTNLFDIVYAGEDLNLKVINNNEFVVWNSTSKIDRVFYLNNEFRSQILNNPSSQQINDINNFKGAYYVSTNNGLNKITEDLRNISEVYSRNEEIIAIQ